MELSDGNSDISDDNSDMSDVHYEFQMCILKF